jgi:hypothetical protein
MEWVSANWGLIAILLYIAINIINAATKHWSEHTGVVKALLFITECLSVLKSAGDGLKLKLPGPGAKPLAMLLLAVSLYGCGASAPTPMQNLEKVQLAVNSAQSAAVPGFHVACTIEARKCIAQGISMSDGCPGWVKCDKARTIVANSLRAAHVAIVEAATLIALGDAKSADQKILLAKEALSRAWDLLRPILDILRS